MFVPIYPLIHRSLVSYVLWASELCHHWLTCNKCFRLWPVACSAPNQNLNQSHIENLCGWKSTSDRWILHTKVQHCKNRVHLLPFSWCAHHGNPVSQLVDSEWRPNAAVFHLIYVSDIGLAPIRHQSIIWTNTDLWFNHTILTEHISKILIEIPKVSIKKILFKMLSAKCRPFVLVSICLKCLHVIITFRHGSSYLEAICYRSFNKLYDNSLSPLTTQLCKLCHCTVNDICNQKQDCWIC